jgi:DNA-binding XRE family transcriptional regulator
LSRAFDDFYHIFLFMGFGKNVKAQLTYADMQVQELATLAGVKKETISSYLGARKQTPSVENAVKIAQALGVSVEFLVTGTEPTLEQSFASLSPRLRSLLKTASRLDTPDLEFLASLAERLQHQ